MFGMFRSCGGAGYLTGLLGGLALACALVSLGYALARRGLLAARLAALALFLSGATGLSGFAGTLAGRKATQEAVANTAASSAALVRRAGFVEARDCSRIGLGAATLPFLLGAVAGALVLFRGATPRDGQPSAPGAPEHANVPLMLGGAACAFTGLLASGGLGAASVGGADYQPAIWALMSSSQQVLEGARSRETACDALEAALRNATQEQARQVTDVGAAAELCVGEHLTRLEGLGSQARGGAGLATLRSASLGAIDPARRPAYAARIAALE